MFKYYSIKKYGVKLLPTLEKIYGVKKYYSASEVRATVYQNDFNPKYLPLGYILFLDQAALNEVWQTEYSALNIKQYQQEITDYLNQKRYGALFEKMRIINMD